MREECQNYDTVIDTNRLWKSSPSQSDQSVPCKDIKFSMNWTRFYYQDSVFNQSAKLLDTCSVNSSLAGAYPCGGYYKGWLVKGHPVKEQGKYLAELWLCIRNHNIDCTKYLV